MNEDMSQGMAIEREEGIECEIIAHGNQVKYFSEIQYLRSRLRSRLRAKMLDEQLQLLVVTAVEWKIFCF